MTAEKSMLPALSDTMRGTGMLQPEEVAAMMRLHKLGWGSKRLAREFGCSRNTARRYVRAGGAIAYRQPRRVTVFDGLEEWLRDASSAMTAMPM